MSRRTINCGFVPLVDSAALVIARELSFAADEGLDLNLLRQPSWSALRDLLAYLEREGALVRAPGDLWFDRAAVDALRDRIATHLRRHGALDTPTYKSLIGTSRKYAVPLMELFDAEGLTSRRKR